MTYEPFSHNPHYVKYDYGPIPPPQSTLGVGVEALARSHRKKILLFRFSLLSGLCSSFESRSGRRTLGARLAHFLFRSRLNALSLGGYVGIQPFLWHIYFLDFEPAHFHRFRDSRNGELGFLAALGLRFIWPADLAQ
jgi:hypothetical protein